MSQITPVRRSFVLLVGVALLIGLLAACSSADATPTPVTEPTPDLPDRPTTPSGGTGTGPTVPTSVLEPSIAALASSPRTVLVAVGATITWRNDAEQVYQLSSDDGWFDHAVAPGESFTWQPDSPGIFTYHDALSGATLGTIVVSQGGAITPEYYGGQPIDKYFADACGGCHGSERQGAVGPALIPGRLTSNDEFYFGVIRDGRPGTIMPAWGALGLSDEEVAGLVGFIRSEPESSAAEWTLAQAKASLEVLVDEATLPSAPTHGANLGNLMFVTEREVRSIAAVDGDTHELVGHIAASYRAHGYAFDPTNDRWLYNVGRDGWVFKIDAYTLEAVRKVRVGHDSRGLAISDDGRFLIAGNFIPTTAVIMDAATLEPLTVIQARGIDPDGVEVDSRACLRSRCS